MQNRVRELREARDLSREELARLAGVTYSYIYKLEERSPNNPSAEGAGAVARALNVTVGQLLGRDPLPIRDPRTEGLPDAALLELQRIWDELDEDKRTAMIRIARELWGLDRKTKEREPQNHPGHPQVAPG